MSGFTCKQYEQFIEKLEDVILHLILHFFPHLFPSLHKIMSEAQPFNSD